MSPLDEKPYVGHYIQISHKPNYSTSHLRLFTMWFPHTWPASPLTTFLLHHTRLFTLPWTLNVSYISAFLSIGMSFSQLSLTCFSPKHPWSFNPIITSFAKPPSVPLSKWSLLHLLIFYKHFYHGIMINALLFYLSHWNLESISYNSLGRTLADTMNLKF